MRMHVFSSPLIGLFPDVPGAFQNSMGFIQLGLKWFEVAALCCLQDMLDSTIDPGPVEVFSQEMVIWVHKLGCITCRDMHFFLSYTVARVKWESYETCFGVNFFAWFCWTLAPLRGPCRSIAVVWRFADGFAVLCWNKSGQDGTALCEDHVLYVHVCSGSNLKFIPGKVTIGIMSENQLCWFYICVYSLGNQLNGNNDSLRRLGRWYVCFSRCDDTVDGWNPAPPGMVKTL